MTENSNDNDEKLSDSFVPRKVIIYRCSNYRGNKPTVIEFESLTAILGETGAGKSSIIDAITFPIWKTTPRLQGVGLKIEDFCDVGGYCEVEFEKNRNLYSIRRGRDNNGGSFVVLTINGKRYPETKPSLIDKMISKIIGMDFESFATTGYVPQDEVKEIILKTASERLELFKKIFKLDVFDKALDITKQRIADTDTKNAKLEGVIQGKRSFLDANKDVGARVNDCSTKIDELEKRLEPLMKKESELSKNKSELEEKEREFNIISTEVNSLSKQIQSYESELTNSETRLQGLLRDEKKYHDQSTVDVDVLQNILDAIKEKMSIENQVTGMRKQYDSIKKSYDARKSQINIATESYDEDGMDLLKQYRDDVRIEAEYVYDVIQNESFCKIYDDIDSEFDAQTRGILEGIETNERRLVALNQIIGAETEKSLRQKIDSENGKQTMLVRLRTQIESLKQSVSERKAKKDEITKEYNEKKKMLEPYKDVHDDYIKCKSNLNKLSYDISLLVSERESNLGRLKELQKIMDDMEKYRSEIKNDETELAKIIVHKTVLGIVKNSVFHKKGMAMYTLRSILSDLERSASEIITILTEHREPAYTEDGVPNRMQKLSLIPLETRYGGIEIEVDGVNVKRFSGGEKTIISIAIRLALSKKLLEMSSLESNLRIFIIDEGDLGSLDEVTLASFTSLLRSFKGIFDTIILITHIKDATEGFDRIIQIEKDSKTGYSNVVF